MKKLSLVLTPNIALLLCLFAIMTKDAKTSIPHIPSEVIEVEAFILDQETTPIDYALIKKKALFHRTRAQIKVVVEKDIKKERVRIFPVSDLTLKGIVFQDGIDSVAYLINNQSNQEFGLKVNQAIEGWKITEIHRNSINLDNGGQLAQLRLLNEE